MKDCGNMGKKRLIKYCRCCGGEMTDDAKFCPYDGMKLDANDIVIREIYEKSNCWIPIGEVNIPPVLHKGFRESVIIRKPIQPIVVKKEVDREDDTTVIIRHEENDGESPTVFIARKPVIKVYLKRAKDGEIINVEKDNFVIGKSVSADFVIKDNPTISRQHAAIVKRKDGYYLEDLKSTNHTYVDGNEVIEAIPLIDGMEFRLAEEKFIFYTTIEKEND